MNDSSVSPRTVVVTGATSGLGRATAGELARTPGWTVVVVARDRARGERTAAELGDGAVALPLDLADLASVRAFTAALEAAGLAPLHAVVANAGIQYTDRRHTTADGFEATFGTNHLGHFLLLRLLLPALADDGRIAIVSSGTHKPQRLRNFGYPPPAWQDPRALATPGDGSGQVAYATSKLANVLTALELARRMPDLRPGSSIAVHAYDPGLMPAAALTRNYPRFAQRVYPRLTSVLVGVVPGITTAARSGAQLARIVTDPAYSRPSGRYVELDRVGTPSAQAQDRAVAADLWSASEQLVGLA